jgi:hypothetical protein
MRIFENGDSRNLHLPAELCGAWCIAGVIVYGCRTCASSDRLANFANDFDRIFADDFMGGSGSGRTWYSGAKDTIESTRALDIRRLLPNWRQRQRKGFSWPWCGPHIITWFCNDRATGSVEVEWRASEFVLGYAVDGEPVSQYVPLDQTRCHFGSIRQWFLCPFCGRRCALLYLAGRRFGCRICAQLAYESTREAAHSRRLSKAQKIRISFGGSASVVEEFPQKPKSMHWKTYWRLRDESERANWLSLIGAARKLGMAADFSD